jgi:hypothetical protein
MASFAHRVWLLEMVTLSLALVLAQGCEETDGAPIGKDNLGSICNGGAPARQPVQPHVIKAFPPCCDGSAHWVPEGFVPAEFRDMLERDEETGRRCVPDIYAEDPTYTPRKCTSLFGQPGACISSCVELVGEADMPLPKDLCEGNELCAPCIDPRDDIETGACKLGFLACEPADKGPCKDYDPAMDLSQFPSCCQTGAAHCAPDKLVPESQKKDLSSCDSGQGPGFCVPDKFLVRGGHYTPRRCKSIGGREGRCLSVCVKSVAKDLDSLPRDACEADERCAPCFDPRTGLGTGACTVGHCDEGPTEPPRPFDHCGPNGDDSHLCVPSQSIPIGERCNFDKQGCNTAPCKDPKTLCVPRKVVLAGPIFTPKKCTNDLTGFLALFKTLFKNPLKALTAMEEYKEGRCLSSCLPKVRPKAKLLGQNGCDTGEVCVPCYDPEKIAEGKVPTGACMRPSCPTPGTS